MSPNYKPGQYSKEHLKDVEEICDLRHLYDMPCSGCIHKNQSDCPEMWGKEEQDSGKSGKR